MYVVRSKSLPKSTKFVDSMQSLGRVLYVAETVEKELAVAKITKEAGLL